MTRFMALHSNLATLCLALLITLSPQSRPHTLLLVNAQDNSNAPCTLCIGGEDANLTATVGGAADGVPCAALVDNLEGITPQACQDLQLLGFRYCGCSSYPTDAFCPMCQDAVTDLPVRFQLIPGGGGDTCDDRLFVPVDDVDGNCSLAQKPGYACGCPNAEIPACQICGGESNDITTNPLSEDRVTVPTIGSFTCQEWANQAVLGDLDDIDQCALVTDAVTEVCCRPVEVVDEETDTSGSDSGSTGGNAGDTTAVESDVNATTPPTEATEPPQDDNNSAAIPTGGNVMAMRMMVAAAAMTALVL